MRVVGRVVGRIGLGLLAIVVLGAADSDFKPFVSKEDGFSTVFPGTPKREVRTVSTPHGATQLHSYEANLGTTEVTYLVTRSLLPKPGLVGKTKGTILENVAKGVVSGSKSTLVSQRAVMLGAHPGKELKLLANGGKTEMWFRIFFVNGVLYQVVVSGPKGEPVDRQRTNWLDEFKLVPSR